MLPVKLKKKEKIGNENTDKSFVTVPVFNIKEKLTDKTAFSKPGLQLFLWHLHNYVFPQQAKRKKKAFYCWPTARAKHRNHQFIKWLEKWLAPGFVWTCLLETRRQQFPPVSFKPPQNDNIPLQGGRWKVKAKMTHRGNSLEGSLRAIFSPVCWTSCTIPSPPTPPHPPRGLRLSASSEDRHDVDVFQGMWPTACVWKLLFVLKKQPCNDQNSASHMFLMENICH